MRYIYACFKGYIGFYNGLGLNKVEIDFTKCKNNIILISGVNACGKSTLMNALNPFPDPSSSFTPNQDAEKILTLFDNGDTYNIRIISASDLKGGRKQSKAFISKNGLELNDNGNITTYKEIIFSEFELDANYNSLTKLSSNDRGLGDKTPAERKKFASNIVDNLETYNDIYKTLNKKSLIFKSHINTLHTKIQNIGTKDNLDLTLKSLKQKNDSITSQIILLNNKIVELQTRASMNQEEVEIIQELKNKEKNLSDQAYLIMNQLSLLKKKTKVDMESIESKYNSDIELKSEYIKSRDELKVTWKSESDRMSSLVNSINEMKANIEMYSSDIDLDIEKRYNSSKQKISVLKSSLSELGLSDNISLIYKLSQLLELYPKLIKKIDIFYDGLSDENLKYITLEYDPQKSYLLSNSLSSNIAEIDKIQNLLADTREKMKSLAVLENRPNKCNVDTCPFISDALKIKNTLGNINIEQRLSDLQEELMNLSENSTKIQLEIENCNFCDKKRIELDMILNDLEENKNLFILFNDKDFSDISRFLTLLSNNSAFNNQRDARLLIDTLNTMRALESEYNIFKVLEVEFNATKNKLDLIEKSKISIQKLETDLENITTKISKFKCDIDNYETLISSLELNIGLEKEYLDNYRNYLAIQSQLNPIQLKIKEIEEKSSESIKGVLQINELKSQIDLLTKESNPIVNDIQRLSGQLTMLESYYQEYELYKTKYNMIETLKKYCSPTGGGIQTIFMQLYMSKTLEIANQVLGMLFGGEYTLLDFVINQNEFRIPFIGSGLTVDDISSGSTSQICIMGMAINLALFHQASTKFNIARLDEVDHGLDSRNKFEYINVLFKTQSILNIEQLFVISHAIEADTSMVDIIKLKSYSDFEENVQLGNVIYDYSKEIEKTLS